MTQFSVIAESSTIFSFEPHLISLFLDAVSLEGPTSATGTSFNAGIQFWTSRGFAILDVDYGGEFIFFFEHDAVR
jgi:hypothetical protein